MRITFDARKRAQNLKTHGRDLADAAGVLMSELAVTFEDRRFDYGEVRYVTLGPLEDTIVLVVSTEKGKSARIISMRKATQYEKEICYEQFH